MRQQETNQTQEIEIMTESKYKEFTQEIIRHELGIHMMDPEEYRRKKRAMGRYEKRHK